MPIDNLIPNAFRKKKDTDRQYKNISYHGNPWVENLSRPYEITRGLKGTHLAVWQSHGMFYKIDRNEWRWQRPRLFGTTEDLFTQSFVVPYLIPMLENAGAIVFTPRERNWQRQEVIVDNNTCPAGSQYLEVNYKKCRWTNAPAPGFAQRYSVYPDNHNPFADGTARMITTQTKPEKLLPNGFPTFRKKGNMRCTSATRPCRKVSAMPNILSSTTEALRNSGLTSKWEEAHGFISEHSNSTKDAMTTAWSC